MDPQWLYATIPPFGLAAGWWVIAVEQRLSKIDAIKETVDKTDAKVERLVEHLIDESRHA